jgi:hypothetical protein
MMYDPLMNKFRQGTLLNVFDALAPTALALTVISDTQINLAWTVNSTNADGHKIERSLDGITYSEIGSVLGATATYNDTTGADGTRYYYRVRAYQGTAYSAYGNVANDWCAIKMVLTSTGTGSGVSTVCFWFGANVAVTLDGAGKWYSDAAGTANESASYTFVGGSLQTRYLKVTSGVSNMLVFAKGNWLRWGDSSFDGFVSGVNAASIAKNISTLTTLIALRVSGKNIITGSISNLINLTYVSIGGSNTLSGNVNPIVNGIIAFNLQGNNQMADYTSGAVWSIIVSSSIIPAAGYGYSSAEIDAILIDLAASLGVVTNQTITLTGSSQSRTAASNAAVTTLNGKGWTIVTNP